MFGLLEFPDAAGMGEAHTRIAMRKTAILAVRKYFDMVPSFGSDSQEIVAGFIGELSTKRERRQCEVWHPRLAP
jgi:hypothetical protein